MLELVGLNRNLKEKLDRLYYFNPNPSIEEIIDYVSDKPKNWPDYTGIISYTMANDDFISDFNDGYYVSEGPIRHLNQHMDYETAQAVKDFYESTLCFRTYEKFIEFLYNRIDLSEHFSNVLKLESLEMNEVKFSKELCKGIHGNYKLNKPRAWETIFLGRNVILIQPNRTKKDLFTNNKSFTCLHSVYLIKKNGLL